MNLPLTVMIVGAGRFGQNYLNILSKDNTQLPTPLPRIDALVLSRTTLLSARHMAETIAAAPTCAVKQVVGVEIANEEQLHDALKRHAPQLICITARDAALGDAIHARYAKQALDFGAVLCEKPFSSANGDDFSLAELKTLASHPNATQFGLELPMAVLGRAMAKDAKLQQQWQQAEKIMFLWEKIGHDSECVGDLVNDLAIHPWSLLPPSWQTSVEAVQMSQRHIDITLGLNPDQTRLPAKPCLIRLATGGQFRGFCLDKSAFQIRFEKGQLQLHELSIPWQAVISGEIEPNAAVPAISVDNPLRYHIRAALAGKPFVDVQRTYQSQQFLEQVQAYLIRELRKNKDLLQPHDANSYHSDRITIFPPPPFHEK